MNGGVYKEIDEFNLIPGEKIQNSATEEKVRKKNWMRKLPTWQKT